MANTIDILTDDVVFKQLVERTLAEYIDDNIDRIGEYAFSYCGNLTKVECNNLSELASSALSYCGGLQYAIFPNVTTIGEYAFIDGYSLLEADYPLITEIKTFCFYNCPSLLRVNTPLVTKIGGNALQNCSRLTSLSFPKVREIGINAFAGDDNLKEIHIGTNVTDSVCILEDINAIPDAVESIYVHADLVENYKTATNWINFADKIKAEIE